jgi:hypothetical protein
LLKIFSVVILSEAKDLLVMQGLEGFQWGGGCDAESKTEMAGSEA